MKRGNKMKVIFGTVDQRKIAMETIGELKKPYFYSIITLDKSNIVFYKKNYQMFIGIIL